MDKQRRRDEMRHYRGEINAAVQKLTDHASHGAIYDDVANLQKVLRKGSTSRPQLTKVRPLSDLQKTELTRTLPTKSKNERNNSIWSVLEANGLEPYYYEVYKLTPERKGTK